MLFVDTERAWADIDLDALAHNLAVIRARVGEAVAILLVVKADAYGHGAVGIAHHALSRGVAGLGVGTSAEALALRNAGVRAPIVVLGTIVDAEVAACLHHAVEIGLHSESRLRTLQEAARAQGVVARVHLNVDTGMARLGVLPERALDLLRAIRDASHLELAGIMTHVTDPNGAWSPTTTRQMREFAAVLAAGRAEGVVRGRVHVANSACVFSDLAPLYDAVRPGIAAYGALPADLPGANELRPVLSLRTQVVFMKDVRAGTAIGYASTWTARRRTRIATLPLGYADGVPLRLSNRGVVLVRGRRAPIVGQVSMDYTTIDVTDIEGVAVGDRVTLIGTDGAATIRVTDVARAAATIPYAVTCAIGSRVRRVYRGEPQVDVPRPARPLAAFPDPYRAAR